MDRVAIFTGYVGAYSVRKATGQLIESSVRNSNRQIGLSVEHIGGEVNSNLDICPARG